MALEFDEGGYKISSKHEQLPKEYTFGLVSDMRHGEVGYIDDEDWSVDKEGKAWVVADAALGGDDKESILSLSAESMASIVRIIRLDAEDNEGQYVKGYVLDLSNDPLVNRLEIDEFNWEDKINRKKKIAIDDEEDDSELLEVIAIGYDKMSIESLRSALKRQFNLDIGECSAEQVFDSMSHTEDED